MTRTAPTRPVREEIEEVLRLVCDEALGYLGSVDERAVLPLRDRRLDPRRYYAGTTTFAGHVALRPALVNWRTREEDVDGFVAVVRELLARLR